MRLLSSKGTHGWLMINLVSTRTPRSFPAELPSSWVPPAWPGAWVVPPQGQDSALLLVGLHEVLVSPPLQPVEGCLDGRATLWLLLPLMRYLQTC